MRGTRHVRRRGTHVPGIIPALAGNTVFCAASGLLPGDHPRACGEHLPEEFSEDMLGGSSPRLRGTHRLVRHMQLFPGIIPALAGNTRKSSCSPCPGWDHPRACGEHFGDVAPADLPAGSSPRLRGTLPYRGQGAAAHGIIPALAGNTTGAMRRHGSAWDHPRACGEHSVLDHPPPGALGSSPRLRGTPARPAPA